MLAPVRPRATADIRLRVLLLVSIFGSSVSQCAISFTDSLCVQHFLSIRLAALCRLPCSAGNAAAACSPTASSASVEAFLASALVSAYTAANYSTLRCAHVIRPAAGSGPVDGDGFLRLLPSSSVAEVARAVRRVEFSAACVPMHGMSAESHANAQHFEPALTRLLVAQLPPGGSPLLLDSRSLQDHIAGTQMDRRCLSCCHGGLTAVLIASAVSSTFRLQAPTIGS